MASLEETDQLSPSETQNLIGHKLAENQLLNYYNTGRIPHAILISGAKGIGKATLAYRWVKFLFSPKAQGQNSENEPDMFGGGGSLFGDDLPASNSSTPDSGADGNQNALAVDHHAPPIQRIIAGSHGDLRVLYGGMIDPEKGTAMKSGLIPVAAVRQAIQFMQLKPGEADYKAVIIDLADDMNNSAANALLKLLEEPPENSFFILLSTRPGQLLPTIRSRCRLIKLSPLSPEDMLIWVGQTYPELGEQEKAALIDIAQGAPGYFSQLITHEGLELLHTIIREVYDALKGKGRAGEIIAKDVSHKDHGDRFKLFHSLLDDWLSRLILAKMRKKSIKGCLPNNLDQSDDIDQGQVIGLLERIAVDQLMTMRTQTNVQLQKTYAPYFLDKRLVILNLFGQFKSDQP